MVKGWDGATTTIHVDGSTTYKAEGKNSAALSDIAVGDQVDAAGTLRSDGWLDAVAVHALPAKPAKPVKPDKPQKSRRAPKVPAASSVPR